MKLRTARCACRKAVVICNLNCHPHNRQCGNVNYHDVLIYSSGLLSKVNKIHLYVVTRLSLLFQSDIQHSLSFTDKFNIKFCVSETVKSITIVAISIFVI